MNDQDRPDVGTRMTRRLRLEPVGAQRAADLCTIRRDDSVWPWYGSSRPTPAQVAQSAEFMGSSWRRHGVHKWIAYERRSGEPIGRGGISRTPLDDDWGQVYRFLPDEPWVRVAHKSPLPSTVHRHWVEIGWALRRAGFRSRGYAAEIGRAGLDFAFRVLGVEAVVSCTVRHNARSRSVMERIGMRYAGEIFSRGTIEGLDGEHDDAPFATCVLLRNEWSGDHADLGPDVHAV